MGLTQPWHPLGHLRLLGSVTRLVVIGCLVALLAAPAWSIQGEEPTADDVTAAATGEDVEVDVAASVEVRPDNSDEQIATRLTEIFDATGWFNRPRVRVDRGVAFLSGQTDTPKHAAWAEATAMNTSDVVAVVNQLAVTEQPFWNFSPAVASLKQIGRETTSILPLLLFAIAIITAGYYVARAVAWLTRRLAGRRIDSVLLQQVAGNVAGVLIFIIGCYIALRVSGLTRLAVTLLGGTGLVGLALGFAFRDIAENYLASILLSLNHPFRVGDLIEVEGAKGFVRKVTTRGTILNTLEGNQIQLPNSTVYKGMIVNYTATPLRRLDFGVGIGFDDSIVEAQTIMMGILNDHHAVQHDPAPLVLVESLGSATVNLRVYYWFDQSTNSPLKVNSSVIRLVKQELTRAGITMPDEARELIFPQGVPVRMLPEGQPATPPRSPSTVKTNATEPEVGVGEGDLGNEQDEVSRVTAGDAITAGEPNLIG